LGKKPALEVLEDILDDAEALDTLQNDGSDGVMTLVRL
jgi:hypothetical protein